LSVKELPIFAMGMHRLFVYIAITGLLSCSGSEGKGRLLAKVNDNELYEADLKNYLAEQEFAMDDSAFMASKFIEDWVDEQILVQEAIDNDKIDNELIEKKVEKFRREMYILELEHVMVNEKL